MSDFEIGGQISMFEGNHKFKFSKRIRLIELFGGIGAQAKALERLKVDFEHYKMCEIDKYAVKSYNAIHGTNFEPSDITKIHADDLEIVDTDKFCYIMTYSFPCQDLSIAGKQAGMTKGSGTRSGLLWEVERILKELNGDDKPLPQVILMENVPEVIGKKNIRHFAEWIKTLDELGYKNKWQLLNAKDYEIPQNRNRCFMVSILGDYYYEFPQSIKLEKRLKDLLEDKVDEKYYLSNKTRNMFEKHTEKKQAEGCGFKFEPTDGTGCAKCISTRAGGRTNDNFIKCEQLGQIKGTFESKGRVYSSNGLCPTINTCGGGQREPKIMEVNNKTICLNSKVDGKQPSLTNRVYDSNGCSTTITTSPFFMGCILEEPIKIKETTKKGYTDKKGYTEAEDYRIRKLTPKECWRLMDFDDGDIDRAKAVGISDSQLYRQAGNSICVNVLVEIFRKMI